MNLMVIGSAVVPPRDLVELIESLERKIVFILAIDFTQAMSTLDSGVVVSSVLFNTGDPPDVLYAQAAAIVARCRRRRIKVGAISRVAGRLETAMLGEDRAAPAASGRGVADLLLGLDPRRGAAPFPSSCHPPGELDASAVEPIADAVRPVGAGRAAVLRPETAGPAPGDELTPRQREVLELVCEGRSNRDIALALRLTEGTVKVHCKSIYRALGVRNRTQAALVARRTNPDALSPA